MTSAGVWGWAPGGAQGAPSSWKVFSLERPKEGQIVWFIGRLINTAITPRLDTDNWRGWLAQCNRVLFVVNSMANSWPTQHCWWNELTACFCCCCCADNWDKWSCYDQWRGWSVGRDALRWWREARRVLEQPLFDVSATTDSRWSRADGRSTAFRSVSVSVLNPLTWPEKRCL